MILPQDNVVLMLVALLTAFCGSLVAQAAPSANSNTQLEKSSRLEKITSMYAWEGFVYALDVCSTLFLLRRHFAHGSLPHPKLCPTLEDLVHDFSRMRQKGARNVITFDYCGTGDDASYYDGISNQVDI